MPDGVATPLKSCYFLHRENPARKGIIFFLKEFPAQKKEIERCIASLLKLADTIDEAHKNITITNIAASSTGASSGIFIILGIVLAPFTTGVSLILTASGLGLGVVAFATGLSATIYEIVSTSKDMTKAQDLMSECGKTLQIAKLVEDFNNEALEEILQHFISIAAGKVPDAINTVQGIQATVKQLKNFQAHHGLKVLAKKTAAGSATHSTMQAAKHLTRNRALTATAQAMGSAAHLLSAAVTGVVLLFDAFNMFKNAKDLSEGAKTEKAAEIREKARKLEAELQAFNKLYEEMKDKL